MALHFFFMSCSVTGFKLLCEGKGVIWWEASLFSFSQPKGADNWDWPAPTFPTMGQQVLLLRVPFNLLADMLGVGGCLD
jgi:hypothetical protein